VGYAVRIGQRIPLPTLLVCRGRRCVLNRVVRSTERTLSRWGGIRIWLATWILEFYLDRPPAQPLPTLADPILGFNGSGGNTLGQSTLISWSQVSGS
jgi:hypothetical protein